MVDIRYPSITGVTEQEQLSEIRSYLYQLAEELQVALGQMEKTAVRQEEKLRAAGEQEKPGPAAQFQSIKALIIKSADIVEAYYGKIDELIAVSGKYLARSVFGEYQEKTDMAISANSTGLNQTFSRLETVQSDVAGIGNWKKEQESYIRYGEVGTSLDDSGAFSDTAVGIEIGSYGSLTGGGTAGQSTRYARFTAYGLELFGGSKNTAPVAYIKQSKLYITNAEVTSSLKLGGFLINKYDGLSFDWVGL